MDYSKVTDYQAYGILQQFKLGSLDTVEEYTCNKHVEQQWKRIVVSSFFYHIFITR